MLDANRFIWQGNIHPAKEFFCASYRLPALPEELMEDALYREQLDKDRISQLVRGLQDGKRLALSSGDEEST